MTEDPGERMQALLEASLERVGEDDLAGRLLLASLANELAGDQVELIVVGGTAVDAYVGGAFGTSEGYPAGWMESLDVDTVAVSTSPGGGREELKRILEEHGFEPSPTGGSYLVEGVPYALDIVARELPTDYSRDHTVLASMELETVDPQPVRLVGPEDLLFDYLESAVDTRHQRDWARALAIGTTLEGNLDLSYLYSKAHWRRDGEYVGDLDRLLAGEPLSA